jgi:DNA-binding transcriptional LysR family regulator
MQPMATSSSTACSISRRTAETYIPPTPLEDLHVLDVLELAGSQHKAARELEVHQTTVCRSLQLMQQQFRLEPRHGSPVCRYGHNTCLHYLRLAYREHRLMEGLLRIGTDVLHQSLLMGISGVQLVPPQFRNGEHWAELVRHGLLDGAIVSSFCLEKLLLSGQFPQWDGLAALPLGQLDLQLVATTPSTRRVLLPGKGATPQLHQAVESHGFSVQRQPMACQEPTAWIKRARDRNLAMPVRVDLLGKRWIETHGLVPLAEQPPLIEQLWLLLPQGTVNTKAARQCLRRLRVQITKAVSMRDPHENKC